MATQLIFCFRRIGYIFRTFSETFSQWVWKRIGCAATDDLLSFFYCIKVIAIDTKTLITIRNMAMRGRVFLSVHVVLHLIWSLPNVCTPYVKPTYLQKYLHKFGVPHLTHSSLPFPFFLHLSPPVFLPFPTPPQKKKKRFGSIASMQHTRYVQQISKVSYIQLLQNLMPKEIILTLWYSDLDSNKPMQQRHTNIPVSVCVT